MIFNSLYLENRERHQKVVNYKKIAHNKLNILLVSGGLNNAAGWFKETASPAIRDKFNEYKEKLQDPETHKNIREWLSEKYDAASEFTKEEIMPELKKVYEAATADVTTKEPKEEKENEE
uniref:Phage protein n=1 Tax=Caenorhabditis tropicalis TaxID=1561998 RepID=A0A1I7UX49_9PELO